jgi:hypothetical protein
LLLGSSGSQTFGASPYSLVSIGLTRVKVLAPPVTITSSYDGGPPPDPPQCN